MKTTTALLFKFILTFSFAFLAFYLIGNPLSWVFLVSLAVTFLNYVIGDLMVLPGMGNVVASLGDGGLGALTAYIFDLISPAFNVSLLSLIIFAALISVGEYFFHMYLIRAEKVAP